MSRPVHHLNHDEYLDFVDSMAPGISAGMAKPEKNEVLEMLLIREMSSEPWREASIVLSTPVRHEQACYRETRGKPL